jgi:hypothetical protein
MITNGTITFEKRINDGDFQHRIAKAEITFTVDAGDADIADEARCLAQRQVFASLGITPSGLVVPASMPLVVETPERLAATTSAMEQRHQAEAVAMPESDQVGAGESGMPAPRNRGRRRAADPTVIAEAPQTASVEQDASSPPSSGAVAPTDEMLRSACAARQERGLAEGNATIGDEIRALIAHYVGEPGRKAADISMKDRPAFLRYLLAQTLHVGISL